MFNINLLIFQAVVGIRARVRAVMCRHTRMTSVLLLSMVDSTVAPPTDHGQVSSPYNETAYIVIYYDLLYLVKIEEFKDQYS